MLLNKNLYPNLCEAVVNGLHKIFIEDLHAGIVVPKLIKKNKKWGKRDRNFISYCIYEIVRKRRLLFEINNLHKLHQDRELWLVLGAFLITQDFDLPSWKEFENLEDKKIKAKHQNLLKLRVYRESIPDWLDELGSNELGETLWENEMRAQNEEAAVFLRVNTLKTTISKLKSQLHNENIQVKEVQGYKNALVLEQRKSLKNTPSYQSGLFEIQDVSSQGVSHFLNPKPNSFIIDACSGAGGKALHLASLMKNTGKIVALDILQIKLEELKKRALRNGVKNIQIQVIEESFCKSLEYKADAVLIDAPCSGMGVLRRYPDNKWKVTPDSLNELKNTQAKLLQDCSKWVKVKGKLVYATCSILPSENKKQIEQFLATKSGKNFTFIEDNHIFTHQSGSDGFYMASLIRDK